MEWNAQEIRGLRLRLGWSAAELGRRLGVSVVRVMEWEAATSLVDSESINHLCFLRAFVEQNSLRVQQMPLAEVVMNKEQLLQVTHHRLAELNFES